MKKYKKAVKLFAFLSVAFGATASLALTSCSEVETYKCEKFKNQTTINSTADHFEKVTISKIISEEKQGDYSVALESSVESIKFIAEIVDWETTIGRFYINLTPKSVDEKLLTSTHVQLHQAILFEGKVVSEEKINIVVNPEPQVIPYGDIIANKPSYEMLADDTIEVGSFTVGNIADFSQLQVSFVGFDNEKINNFNVMTDGGSVKISSPSFPTLVSGKLVLYYGSLELNSSSFFSINVIPKEKILISLLSGSFDLIEKVLTKIGTFEAFSITNFSEIVWKVSDETDREIDYLTISIAENEISIVSENNVKNIRAKIEASIEFDGKQFAIGLSDYFTFSCRAIKPQVEVMYNYELTEIRKNVETKIATYRLFNISDPNLLKFEITIHEDEQNWKISNDKNGNIFIKALDNSTETTFDLNFTYAGTNLYCLEKQAISSRNPQVKIDVVFDDRVSNVSALIDEKIGFIKTTDVDDMSQMDLKFYDVQTSLDLKWEWKFNKETENTYSLLIFCEGPTRTVTFYCDVFYGKNFLSKTKPKEISINNDHSPKVDIKGKSASFELDAFKVFGDISVTNVEIADLTFKIIDADENELTWETQVQSTELFIKPKNVLFTEETKQVLIRVEALYKGNVLYKSKSLVYAEVYKPNLYPEIFDGHFLDHCDVPIGILHHEMYFSIKNIPSSVDIELFTALFVTSAGTSIKDVSIALIKMPDSKDQDKNTIKVMISISADSEIMPNTPGKIQFYFKGAIIGETPSLTISSSWIGFLSHTSPTVAPKKESKICQLHQNQVMNDLYKNEIRISFSSSTKEKITTWKYKIGNAILDKLPQSLVSFDIFLTPPQNPTDDDKEVFLVFEMKLKDTYIKICSTETPIKIA